MSEDLNPDLVAFLQSSIRSLWALELVLLLRRDALRTWTEDELDRELRASPLLIASCLQQLERAGLTQRDADGRWRYAPATTALTTLADLLAETHRSRPFAVINTLFSSADQRLRNFAEAFRFRSKDE